MHTDKNQLPWTSTLRFGMKNFSIGCSFHHGQCTSDCNTKHKAFRD